MKFELAPYNRNTSDEDLIADLQYVGKLLDEKKITINQYRKHGKFHPSTLQRRFGGWLKSLQKAGLEETRIYRITDEDYFRNIEHVWLILGRQPYYREIEKPLSKYSKKAYWHRFGSWRNALKAFIKYINIAEESDSWTTTARYCQEKKHKTSRNISWRMRFLVMRRDNFRCRICGSVQNIEKEITLHIDHIVPWTDGGETVIDNLQTLCNRCNIGKSDLPIGEKKG